MQYIKKNIAVVGGGVAGATTALYLGQSGITCTLFEREKSLISGPPFCHLHAGGNLYREISDAEWMIPVAKEIDFEKVKFPLIMVQEYGLNLFRLSAGISLALAQIDMVEMKFETKVTEVCRTRLTQHWQNKPEQRRISL